MEDTYEEVHEMGLELGRNPNQTPTATTEDSYEHLRVMHNKPVKKPQNQPSTTTAVKIILGLVAALLFVVVVAVMVCAVLYSQQISELKEKHHKLEQLVHGSQTKTTGLINEKEDATSAKPHSTTTSSSTVLPPSETPHRTTASPSTLPSHSESCHAMHSTAPQKASGVFTIHPQGYTEQKVYCDMETDGGGWTVFQRRLDGALAFNRTWAEYKLGFGSVDAEFWLGNEVIYYLTRNQRNTLRVDLTDWDGNTAYATYSTFGVDNEYTHYRLSISGYNGTAGDTLRIDNAAQFSAIDRDNDRDATRNCAVTYRGGGGWWYSYCDFANLNGRYFVGGVLHHTGVVWQYWKHNWYSMKETRMMLRPHT